MLLYSFIIIANFSLSFEYKRCSDSFNISLICVNSNFWKVFLCTVINSRLNQKSKFYQSFPFPLLYVNQQIQNMLIYPLRENKHSMRGRHTSFHSRPNIPPPISAAPYMSGPPFPPVSPNGAPYQPISPSYGGPVQIPPEYYGMPPNNFQSGYQQPYYNQGWVVIACFVSIIFTLRFRIVFNYIFYKPPRM